MDGCISGVLAVSRNSGACRDGVLVGGRRVGGAALTHARQDGVVPAVLVLGRVDDLKC